MHSAFSWLPDACTQAAADAEQRCAEAVSAAGHTSQAAQEAVQLAKDSERKRQALEKKLVGSWVALDVGGSHLGFALVVV